MVTVTGTKLLALFVVGVLFILIGGIIDVVFDQILPRKIDQEVTLNKGSTVYNDWVENPVPTYFQVWVFDIQNAAEVIQKGDKPCVQERGPYTYREYRQKVNITYHDNNTVSYREVQSYVFDEELSVGLETDVITAANVLMMTIADMIRFEFSFITELTELVLDSADDSKLLRTYTVSEILWGYDDPLLSLVNSILKKHNVSLQIDSRIGLFYGKNNSDDGLYTVFTEHAKIGTISSWNGLTEMEHWTTETCRMINGTEGRFFHSNINTDDTLYVFASDVFRSFYLEYLGEKTIKDIKLSSFVIPDHLFAYTEENAGFCTPYGHCTPYGMINISLYKQNAPIIISQPHFYASDPDVIDSIIGLHPTPIEHQTILDIEPMTGVVMNVNKRLQINIHLESVPNIRDSAKFTKGLYLPMAWVNESGSLDDAAANRFKNQIMKPIQAVTDITYGVMILGALMSGSVIVFACQKCIVNNIKKVIKGDRYLDENEQSKLLDKEKQIQTSSSS